MQKNMKLIGLTILLSLTTMIVNAQENFKAQQLKFDRVKDSYNEKWPALQNVLSSKGFKNDFSIVINAYKTEGKLEIWLKNKKDKSYSLFKTYDFCAHSGIIGPKMIEGDGQTPEGFYTINVFNPMSTYYLSLGIDFPNSVDYNRTGKDKSPGSDIYIHGNCVTVGCIPLTDEKIKEVYILAVEARNAGQEKIPVNIYPFKMTAINMKKYTVQFPIQVDFWKNLQRGYTYFEKNKLMPQISQEKGEYQIK